jgi:hypothetical protein
MLARSHNPTQKQNWKKCVSDSVDAAFFILGELKRLSLGLAETMLFYVGLFAILWWYLHRH